MKQKKVYRKSPDNCCERRKSSGGDLDSFNTESPTVTDDIFTSRVPSHIKMYDH